MAASGMARVFEKADASLALVAQRLETDATRAFEGSAGLNPTRLLKRLAVLEEELPRLKAAAEKNAAMRRTVLGALHAQQCANQTEALELARRSNAAAAVHDDAASWRQAEAKAAQGLAKPHCIPAPPAAAPDSSSLAAATPRAPSQAPSHVGSAAAAPSPRYAAPAPAPAQSLDPPPPLATSSPAAVSELTYLRLSHSVRDGVSLDDLNTFWEVLRSLFVRRETRELQAAQLLALVPEICASPHSDLLADRHAKRLPSSRPVSLVFARCFCTGRAHVRGQCQAHAHSRGTRSPEATVERRAPDRRRGALTRPPGAKGEEDGACVCAADAACGTAPGADERYGAGVTGLASDARAGRRQPGRFPGGRGARCPAVGRSGFGRAHVARGSVGLVCGGSLLRLDPRASSSAGAIYRAARGRARFDLLRRIQRRLTGLYRISVIISAAISFHRYVSAKICEKRKNSNRHSNPKSV